MQPHQRQRGPIRPGQENMPVRGYARVPAALGTPRATIVQRALLEPPGMCALPHPSDEQLDHTREASVPRTLGFSQPP